MSSEPNPPVSSAADSRELFPKGANVPVWLIVLMFLLFFWGALYFDDNGGWFDARIYMPYRSVEEVQQYQISGGPDPLEAGRAIYAKTCVACHQASGQGAPGQFPPLVGSEWVNESDAGRVIRFVLNGLQGPITVKGQSFNNTMVPWNSLSDQDIAAVISFVRQNKDWGNNAAPVTPERIKAVREKIKNHPGAFTPDELMKISPSE
jgi:mono/diheme cytochrome c family protein